MARVIPTSLAGVVEHLELEGDHVVTLESLHAALEAAGDTDPSVQRVREVAYRLQRAGWLATLRTRSTWEFLPAARGGPYRSGDRFVEFRAYAATHGTWAGALAMESAASLHGLAQRLPEREVVALPKPSAIPKALGAEWRVITTALPMAALTAINGLRTWTLEGLLVGIAERPSNYRDVAGLGQWLPEATPNADIDHIRGLLEPMPTPVRQRAAYLFSAVGLADERDAILGPTRPAGVAWFGPRGRGGIFDAVVEVNDTVLRPFLTGGTGA